MNNRKKWNNIKGNQIVKLKHINEIIMYIHTQRDTNRRDRQSQLAKKFSIIYKCMFDQVEKPRKHKLIMQGKKWHNYRSCQWYGHIYAIYVKPR